MKVLISVLLLTNIASANVTYTKNVKPIFQKRCILCHTPGNVYNIPNWFDYKTAYDKRDKIKLRVYVEKSMPLGLDMPQEEREVVKNWVDQGGKE